MNLALGTQKILPVTKSTRRWNTLKASFATSLVTFIRKVMTQNWLFPFISGANLVASMKKKVVFDQSQLDAFYEGYM